MLPFKFVDIPPSYDAAEVFYVRIDPSIGIAEELIRALYYLLWLPGYFGFNWDALYDCLRDLSWIPCHKIVLVHVNLPELPREDLQVYLEILRDAVLDWVGDEEHEIEVVFREIDRLTVENLLEK
ncbi:barstar family protein [Pseudomonas sp. 5P_3.1_Bac2]|uniref:barstar family protein n=1 Tax=Pseudomonas sp. 5P_3.1_Bac2 TaxID=2971617 RepID=UPI0021C68D6A|nr:barstar family protein [Pseudomonas sp. 5P_3.1_Bac2]MCU1719277.1 barstar family protein [Pseudomonas sp. 5P_3.1_Bac2]